MPTAPPPKAPPKTPPKAPPSPPSRTNGNAKPPEKIEFKRGITEKLAPRILLYGAEGVGKTTIGAHMEKPVALMDETETGYLTLLANNLVPEIDYEVSSTWTKTLAVLDHLIDNDTGHTSLFMDAISGFEKQCHRHVCDRDFKGEWGEKGFMSYHKGYELAANDWLGMIAKLDILNKRKGMAILLLSHCKVKTYSNPLGENFDRYTPDCHEKTWSPTSKWADAVLFCNFFTVVKEKKGIGTTDRVVYTEHRDAFDAKNRYAMRESFDLPGEHDQAWATIYNEIRSNNQ